MKKIMIEAKNVEYMYEAYEEKDSFKALKGINLTIYEGEYVAILGHNGSGKSTFSKLLNGLEKPTSGHILVRGMNTKEEKHTWDIRKTCGLVFQNPDNQMVATVVEEDVAFGPENLGVPTEELHHRVEEALRLVEMEDFRLRAPHLLSGGQKQRVAIAGILAMEPDCIILDEPTAMLDPIGRKEIMRTLNRLHGEDGKTVVLITHYMEEAVHADRVIVMSDGQIVLDDVPRNVFSQVSRMRSLGLSVPQVTELSHKLYKAGLYPEPCALTVEELVENI